MLKPQLVTLVLAEFGKTPDKANEAVRNMLKYPEQHEAYESFVLSVARMGDGRYLATLNAQLNPGFPNPVAKPGTGDYATDLERAVEKRYV